MTGAVTTLVVIWLALLVAAVVYGVVRQGHLRRHAVILARAGLPLIILPALLIASHVLQQSDGVRRRFVDWSANERNTFASQTGAVLRDANRLGTKLLITGFFPPDQPQWRPMVRTLRRYAEASGAVTVRFVDPDQQPALARQYEIVNQGDVFLDLDLPAPGASRRVRAESATEIDVTTAVVRILNGDRTLCWSSGHGERPPDDPTLQSAVARLDANGYTIRDARLSGGAAVLDGCAALVAASPRAAPLPAEADLLDAFLTAGGRMLLLLDPDDAGDEIARTWGDVAAIGVLPGAVRDPNGGLEREPRALAAERFPSSSPITEKLPAALFLGVRGLAPPPEDPGRGLTVSTLVTASEAATAGDVKAPALGVSLDSSRVLGEGPMSRLTRTRVATFGDADWLQNESLKLLGNEPLLIRTVNWLAEAPTLVSIPAKLVAENLLVLTSSDRRRVDLGVFVLPLAGVSAAAAGRWFLAWRRRRCRAEGAP